MADNENGNRLTVEVTPHCRSKMATYPGGRAGLVVDYGGYELEFIVGRHVGAPEDAHEFAVGLAYVALCFASRCRCLMSPRHAEARDE